MSQSTATRTLEFHLGTELRRRSSELTRLWLDKLVARLDLQPRRVFPSETLLNHIPEVLASISDYLCSGGDPVAGALVSEELGKLARLRREQGYDVDEILAEFDILGGILYDALREEARAFGRRVPPDYAIEVAERLSRALMAIAAVTASTFRQEGFKDRRERARLLGTFGRALAHELKNRLQAAQNAVQLLEAGGAALDEATRSRVLAGLTRSLARIQGVADDVQALAIAQGSEESAQGRHLALRTVIEEVVAELAGVAEEKGVRLEVREIVPEVQVDATRVELALVNLVGNAIKYSDLEKLDRWVRIAVQRHDEQRWRLEVADDGLGIAEEMQHLVFHEFVRAHPEVADGTGLGLAIAREAVAQIGGEIWLDSTPRKGTTVRFTIPDPPSARE